MARQIDSFFDSLAERYSGREMVRCSGGSKQLQASILFELVYQSFDPVEGIEQFLQKSYLSGG